MIPGLKKGYSKVEVIMNYNVNHIEEYLKTICCVLNAAEKKMLFAYLK